MDGSEITSFNISKKISNLTLQSPDENYFANTPQNRSPANVYRSDDCNELLAKELAKLNETDDGDQSPDEKYNLVSQSSIEIDICDEGDRNSGLNPVDEAPEYLGEVNFEHKTKVKCLLLMKFFYLNFVRNGPYWMFILVYLYLMLIVIREIVSIL